MGRGFGRGAKQVAIVTHAQAKHAGKKTPKGLRGGRQKKRQRFQKRMDDQKLLEEELGARQSDTKVPHQEKSLAQQIATIQFPNVINKRKKGFKQLRKQILAAAKDIRKRYTTSKKKQAERNTQ